MADKVYKSIGQIYSDGSTVNGKDAFVSVPPLRQSNVEKGKAINLKTDVKFAQTPKDKRSRLDVNTQTQTDLQLRGNSKDRQKKLQEQTTKSQSNPTTTSKFTKTTSTTTKPTSTTMPRTTERDDGDKSKKRGQRGNNNNSPGNRRGDSSYHTSSTFQEPKSTPFNKFDKTTDYSAYVVDAQSESVTYSINIPSTCVIRPELTSGAIVAGESNSRVLINMTSFASALSDSSLNNVAFYDQFLTLYFNRTNADMIRVTKGVVPSYWTKANLVSYMTDVTKALEYFYTLDSILAFSNVSVSSLSGSRSAQYYGAYFNQAGILKNRDDLRRAFQAMWYPPELAMQIRSFFQWYRMAPPNQAGQATLIRYVPSQTFLSNLANVSNALVNAVNTDITALITSLTTSNNGQICGMLSNMYPQGIINGMPKSCNDAVYDEDMLEIFINEPSYFNDVNSTNVASVVPISYFDNKNDIPYYSFKMPKDMNGANFALQTLPTTPTGTNSGFAWSSNLNYYGLRKILTYGTSPNVSNKFVLDIPNNTTIPRTITNAQYYFSGADTHAVINLSNVTAPINHPVCGSQRVFFDMYTSPATNFNILASKLFGTAV